MIETERLTIRPITTDDAGFLLALLNDESFIRFIGDRGVYDLTEAIEYILDLLEKSQGSLDQLFVVNLGVIDVSIGVCSLRKRDELEDPDIGFAFLPEFRGKGYAYEATRATLDFLKENHGIARVVAIASPDNEASIRLLNRLGFRKDGEIELGAYPEECSVLFVPVNSTE